MTPHKMQNCAYKVAQKGTEQKISFHGTCEGYKVTLKIRDECCSFNKKCY